MYSRNNNNNCTCAHCGTDSLPASEAWINGMEDGEPLLCLNCKKALRDNQTSGWLGSGKKANSNFNISFFIIVFLLSGLLIYLNRTFDVLTFKEDSGQIVYEILLILIGQFSPIFRENSSELKIPCNAEKLGIKTDELRFDRFYETANGTVRGSSTQINDFRIGEIHLREIGASVNEAEMRNSLLGMTFFKRLKSYEVKNDVLTLYWSK